MHQAKMDNYNVIVCPYNASDPHQVYSNLSSKQKLIPTGYKIPSWLVRNMRNLLESGVHSPTFNIFAKDYVDGDDSSSGTSRDSDDDGGGGYRDDNSVTISVGDHEGDVHLDSCQNKSDASVSNDTSHTSDSVTLSHMQEQLNDLKASITELSHLIRETRC